MLNAVKFIAPFLLGATLTYLSVPDLQRLSLASYEEKINVLSSELSSCRTKVEKARKALE